MLDGERISIDDRYPYRSFAEQFLHYLEALGIEKGNKTGKFYHNGKEVEAKMYDLYTIVWDKEGEEIARLNDEHDTLCFINDGKDAAFTISTREPQDFETNPKTKNMSIVYSCDKRYYSLSTFTDIIGETSLVFSSDANHVTVDITIDGERKSAKYYMQELWDLLDTSGIKPHDLKYIHCMFKDLTFQKQLQNKINSMAPDIETAFEMKTNAIKAYHQDEITKAISKILERQEAELEELNEYKEYFEKRQGQNVPKGK